MQNGKSGYACCYACFGKGPDMSIFQTLLVVIPVGNCGHALSVAMHILAMHVPG